MLASMGHVPIAVVYRVARARVRMGWRSATALDNVISFALPVPLARSLSSFSFPVLVALALSVTELMLGCVVIADARSHSLMVMKMVGPPRAGGRTRV
jgi:hypothetical protein